MERIAKFYKVSFEQFKNDWSENDSIAELENIYENIKLPKRATSGSAGYDFYSPIDITLEPGKTIKIPTGIRVEICDGWVLKCYPRSGLGFKFRLQLNNTVGIIDSDYFNSDNEGHIFAKITNDKMCIRDSSTAAPICIIAPVSSWAASVISQMSDTGLNGMSSFVATIPFNLYAILTIVMVIMLSIFKLDFGPMETHEYHALKDGNLKVCKFIAGCRIFT